MVTVLIDTRAIESSAINYLLFFIKNWAYLSNFTHLSTLSFIIYSLKDNTYHTLLNLP